MKKEPTKLMIELDTLLDTRIGTVNRFYPEYVEALLNADYRNRKSDQLEKLVPDIKQHWFNVAYSARDVETLKHSKITPMVVALTNITKELERLAVDTPIGEGVEIDLNIYPYQLSPGEIDMIKLCIAHYSALTAKIEVISQPMSYFTPSILKAQYGGIVIYNLADWLNLHAEALLSCKIPGVSIFAPRRYAVDDWEPTKEDLSFMPDGVPQDIFAFAEEGMLEYIGLFIWDMRMFSFIDPEKLEHNNI